MRELLIATGNPGKYKEIVEALNGLPYEFLFPSDLGRDFGEVVEDGVSFKENAYKKAKHFFDKTGILTLAEDSGVLVNALSGELGVNTRRWGAGADATDEEWLEFFMERMEGASDRGARFECCACLIGWDVGGDVGNYFEGRTEGVITDSVMAPILKGLPLSSCFLPNGFDQVYASLKTEDKNAISHRGKAISQVRSFLEQEDV